MADGLDAGCNATRIKLVAGRGGGKWRDRLALGERCVGYDRPFVQTPVPPVAAPRATCPITLCLRRAGAREEQECAG